VHRSVLDQISKILDVLGTPSQEDIKFIQSERARVFLSEYKSAGIPWKERIPHASVDALDLLSKMLQFNPAKRISAEEALEHPFVAGFHERDTEPSGRKFGELLSLNKLDTVEKQREAAWELMYQTRRTLPRIPVPHPKKTLIPAMQSFLALFAPAVVSPALAQPPLVPPVLSDPTFLSGKKHLPRAPVSAADKSMLPFPLSAGHTIPDVDWKQKQPGDTINSLQRES